MPDDAEKPCPVRRMDTAGMIVLTMDNGVLVKLMYGGKVFGG